MNDELPIEQSNNIDSNSNTEAMNVKIRTLDNEFMVNISSENKVEELKRRIENVSNKKFINIKLCLLIFYFRFPECPLIDND